MTLSRRTRRLATLPALALAAAAVTAGATSSTAAAAPKAKKAPKGPPPVELQLLALNDFHGQLEPVPSSSSGSRLPGFGLEGFGGSEYLATQVRQLEAASKQKNTVTVAAGDLIGATPLLSAAFHDEPAIEALNLIGLDYASVGNHEFDEGPAELLRIQNGGCHPVDGCSDPALPYQGADFQYLSANAFVTATQQPLLPPYAIHKVQGVSVGFIGMTLEGTPSIVTPSGVAGLEFRDEAETANRYVRELRAKGVETIVVLLHEGGSQVGATSVDGCNGPTGPNSLTGPIAQIVPLMDDAIDVVVTGHTHQAYNCVLDGKVVTSASSVGRLVTDIDLTIDRKSGDVIRATADNVPVSRTVPADAAQTALIGRYRTLLGPVAGRVVGTASTAIANAAAPSGERPMGNLIADAQLAATTSVGAVAALMNPGGVRAELDQGPITYEEAFSVQPFGNLLTTITLTGAQLDCVLEQQFAGGRNVVLQPSASLGYTRDRSQPAGTATAPCSGQQVTDLRIDGTLVDPAASYRITVNNFLADGGDGFTQLTGGTARTLGVDDLTALTDYLTTQGTVSAPATNRIRLLP
jgi:5'-nucleotidase